MLSFTASISANNSHFLTLILFLFFPMILAQCKLLVYIHRVEGLVGNLIYLLVYCHQTFSHSRLAIVIFFCLKLWFFFIMFIYFKLGFNYNAWVQSRCDVQSSSQLLLLYFVILLSLLEIVVVVVHLFHQIFIILNHFLKIFAIF